jgi:hypothetical protein
MSIILWNSAFPLRRWIIPPVSRNLKDELERRFLRPHKPTRRVAENAIGILKEKFPCISHERVPPNFACKTVVCYFMHLLMK